MAGFSTEEIVTSVESIVLSSIRRPYDTLGVRRTDVTFTDLQQAAAGVFLLYRDAPFYIIHLACQRVTEAVEIEADLIDQVFAALLATGRDVFPIEDLSPLANARSALLELESAISARSQAFQDIEKVPAFQRYQSNVNSFLGTAGSNVKDNGEVVQTPQEARRDLPSLLGQLKASHAALVASVRLLAGAFDDFSGLNLSALLAAGVISRSRQILSDRLDQLEAETAEQRLADIRAVVLDLLTQKGVIKQFGSFTGPSASFSITGIGQTYSDSSHPATPATLVSPDVPGPYPLIHTQNILDFFDLDTTTQTYFTAAVTFGTNAFEATFAGSFGPIPSVGSILYVKSGSNASTRWLIKTASFNILETVGDHTIVPEPGISIEIWTPPHTTIPLTPSFICRLEGYLPEPYNIHSTGGGFTANDLLKFAINGSVVRVLLPIGSAITAAQVVTAINAAIAFYTPGAPITAEAYVSPLKYDSIVTVSFVSGIIYRFTVLAGNLTGLNILPGDRVRIVTGPDADIELAITATTSSTIDATYGPGLSSFTRQEIQVGPANHKIRIVSTDDAACLSQNILLSVEPDTNSGGVLGILPGVFSQTQPVQVLDLVKDFNQRTTAVVASSSFSADFTGPMRSDPFFPTKVVVYEAAGVGNVTATGLSVSMNNFILSDGSMSDVEVGDILCLRTGPNPDALFTVTAVSDTALAATGLVATSNATAVSFEIGKNFVLSPVAGRTVRIASGPNRGDYRVVSQGTVPFDFTVATNLPLRQTVNATPIVTTGTLGIETAAFTSTDTSVQSNVLMSGSAIVHLSSDTNPSVRGTSPWFQLPSIPRGLQTADLLETFGSIYNVPSNICEITSVDSELLVIGIDPELSPGPWTFSNSIPPPFAKLVAGTVNDASGLTAQLDTWLLHNVNDPAYFVDLARFINPLLANKNPTAVQVNDAKNRLLDLIQFITIAGAHLRFGDTTLTLEAILNSYSATAVPAVDNLITTFKQKGADRAVDILLAANFSGFFGLGVDTSSYSGSMLLAVREMTRNDLPVSKISRADAQRGKLLSSAESNDYEFSTDDLEQTGTQVDPPIAG